MKTPYLEIWRYGIARSSEKPPSIYFPIIYRIKLAIDFVCKLNLETSCAWKIFSPVFTSFAVFASFAA